MMFVYFLAFVAAVWISIGLVFSAFVWLVVWADGRLNPWMEKL
jgi:hypothetical protein